MPEADFDRAVPKQTALDAKRLENTERFVSICFQAVVGRRPSYAELQELKTIETKGRSIREIIDQAKAVGANAHKVVKPLSELKTTGSLKVLVLTTFPADSPKHGGQHRVYNLMKAYREAGHEVHSAGVLGSPSYPPSSKFVESPRLEDLSTYIQNPWLMEDWAIGCMFEHRPDSYQRLKDKIDFTPDVIHVELPWLFGFAERYRRECCPIGTRIVYGSENVEHRLKHSILSNYFDSSWSARASDLVKETELRAIKGSDVICCVSQEELEWIGTLTSQPCLFVPNGAAVKEPEKNDVAASGSITEGKRYALFCASGHPPNITGFWDYFSAGLGCLSPDELLIVAGGVGHSLINDERRHRTPGFDSRVRITNEVEQGVLNALISGAHTIVLPISYGSGTNLKTAEALLSQKHVVATPVAMRGFEAFSCAEGVNVTDRPEEFLKFIRVSMQQPPLNVPDSDRCARQLLSWESCVSALRDFFSSPNARLSKKTPIKR
jgi:hypothetical protein